MIHIRQLIIIAVPHLRSNPGHIAAAARTNFPAKRLKKRSVVLSSFHTLSQTGYGIPVRDGVGAGAAGKFFRRRRRRSHSGWTTPRNLNILKYLYN